MAPGDIIHYRQPDAPKPSASPLEALEPNPYLKQSVISKYGYIALGAFIGGLSIACHNYYAKLPRLAGAYRYPIAVLVGGFAASQLQQYKEAEWAERDAIYRHYISLHPEDFPPYPKIKLADVFDRWTPIR